MVEQNGSPLAQVNTEKVAEYVRGMLQLEVDHDIPIYHPEYDEEYMHRFAAAFATGAVVTVTIDGEVFDLTVTKRGG